MGLRPQASLVSIAGYILRLDGLTAANADATGHLLRYHRLSGGLLGIIAPDATIGFVLGEFGEDRKPVCLSESNAQVREWTWGIPLASVTWRTDHFYYRVLYPILNQTLACLGAVRFHAALLYDRSTSVVLVMGDRGAGKSSVTAGWLDQGGVVASDDTVFARGFGHRVQMYGLYRDLHVDPALADELPRLQGLAESDEYLVGSHRLAYEWVSRFPMQCAGPMNAPRVVLWSQVEAAGRSRIAQMRKDDLFDRLVSTVGLEPENMIVAGDARGRIVRAITERATGWDVAWGPDVWSQAGKQLGFVQRHCGVVPTA